MIMRLNDFSGNPENVTIHQTKNISLKKKYSKSWEYKGPKSSTVLCNENTLKILFKKMITIRIKIKIIVN